MPCGEYTDRNPYIIFDKVAIRLACDRCKEIEASGGKVPAWAKKWWNEHKKTDEERKELGV